MPFNLKNFSGRVAALIQVLFKLARNQSDQKYFASHIIELNKKQSPEQVINETALCLKNMLNYRLFAFVIKQEKHIDVWLDPGWYKKSLEKIFLKDFSLNGKEDITYLNHPFHPDATRPDPDIKDLAFYEIKEENFYSRVYLQADKNARWVNQELVQMMLQACTSVLSRQFKIEKLKNAASVDPLTGCYNRREFINQLNRNIAGASRHKSSLSVFMFDLDHFKRVNDSYGHPAGDKVLKEVALLVKKNMRTDDILARYGGEEFIAILPGTGKIKAIELAERLRRMIAQKEIPYSGKIIRITASFGVTQVRHNTDLEGIIQEADAMLYKAKLKGRNIVMPGIFKIVENKVGKKRKQNI